VTGDDVEDNGEPIGEFDDTGVAGLAGVCVAGLGVGVMGIDVTVADVVGVDVADADADLLGVDATGVGVVGFDVTVGVAGVDGAVDVPNFSVTGIDVAFVAGFGVVAGGVENGEVGVEVNVGIGPNPCCGFDTAG
jgi:hypothetical protein